MILLVIGSLDLNVVQCESILVIATLQGTYARWPSWGLVSISCQKLLNILVKLSTIWQIWMLLLRLWRRLTTPSCKILSLPDTLWVLLTEFASMAWSIASKSGFRPTWPYLIIEVLANQAKFLQPFGYCTVINCTFNFFTTNVLGCFCSIIAHSPVHIY